MNSVLDRIGPRSVTDVRTGALQNASYLNPFESRIEAVRSPWVKYVIETTFNNRSIRSIYEWESAATLTNSPSSFHSQ